MLPSLISSLSLSIWAFRTYRLIRRFMRFYKSKRVYKALCGKYRNRKICRNVHQYLISCRVLDGIFNCKSFCCLIRLKPLKLLNEYKIKECSLFHKKLYRTVSTPKTPLTFDCGLAIPMSCWPLLVRTPALHEPASHPFIR